MANNTGKLKCQVVSEKVCLKLRNKETGEETEMFFDAESEDKAKLLIPGGYEFVAFVSREGTYVL